jgi:undecaprenyl-diphosphatase
LNLFQAILLGLVQGLTEFLPVSSTAHLILVPWLLGWTADPAFARSAFVFDVLVQWGTLVGVFAYFWRDLAAIVRGVVGGLARGKPFDSFEARLGWWVVVATIPAVVAGLLLKDRIENLFSAHALVAGMLMLAALLLIAAERFGKRNRNLNALNTHDAVTIGLWQTLALFPGVSRSSATISGGMLRHLERSAAARFSFLMSIAALLGAGVVALSDLLDDAALLQSLALPLAAGFAAAAVSGYFVIRWLLGYLQKQSLGVFVVYRLLFGALCLLVALIRG